jgi:hypothetical protein
MSLRDLPPAVGRAKGLTLALGATVIGLLALSLSRRNR